MNRRDFLSSSAVVPVVVPNLLARGASPEKTLRAAVIGHTGRGDYGHGLDLVFKDRPGVELVAVADADPSGREKAAARLGGIRAYADYREMLERERPQLASVALRHSDQHAEIGLACLGAGAHVYMEKPLARTPAEADALLAIADRLRLRLAVAHTMRMMPQVVRLRRVIAEGLLGELRELEAWGKQDARAGGEDMMVLGSHLFDLMRMFAGDPVSVSAEVLEKGRRIERSDRRLVKDNVGWVAGDVVSARFLFGSGIRASFTSDGRLRETIGHWGILLRGSKGQARINCDIAPNVFLQTTSGWAASGRTDHWKPVDPALVGVAPEHNLGPVGDWLEAVRSGREPECSGRNAAWAVEMALGVYAAGLGGGRVTFPLVNREHPLA